MDKMIAIDDKHDDLLRKNLCHVLFSDPEPASQVPMLSEIEAVAALREHRHTRHPGRQRSRGSKGERLAAGKEGESPFSESVSSERCWVHRKLAPMVQ